MMMRQLKQFAQVGEPEKHFVASLYIACGSDWSVAQILWEKAVKRAADTKEVHNNRSKAELTARKWLGSILEVLGKNIIPPK
jgi:hypothetical protein